MDNKDKIIYDLQKKVCSLESRVQYLQGILSEAKIPYEMNQSVEIEMDVSSTEEDQGACIIPEEITKNHVKYFYSIFKGRIDVYSKRGSKPSTKTGKTGYYTQCWNFWKDGLCPKKTGSKMKCGECNNKNYKSLMGGNIISHLRGDREDCSDVIGLYPMFPDENCMFQLFYV